MTKAALCEESAGGIGGGGGGVRGGEEGSLYQEHVSASTNQGAKVRRLSCLGVGHHFTELFECS